MTKDRMLFTRKAWRFWLFAALIALAFVPWHLL